MSARSKYEQELNAMFEKLIRMGRNAELAIEQSVTALKTRDKALAHSVMAEDYQIDAQEREIEQDCLRILLLEHPVAGDFREVSSALKMITDLERIGDQAADIAELTLQFGDEAFLKEPQHIEQMAKIVIGMLKDGVQSYINRDVAVARELNTRDDRVDALFLTVRQELVRLIRQNPQNAEQAVLLLMIAKYLERIGDHAVNVGEWATYAATGDRT